MEQLGTLTDDTKAAMAASPDYFARYYIFKSFALVAAVAVAAFLFGQRSRRR